MSKHYNQRSPFVFFALTFAYSWGIWLPALLAGAASYGTAAYFPMAVLGQFAPMAAAITLVWRRHGRAESWRFVRQAFDFRRNPVFFLLPLAISLAIHMAAHYLSPVLGFEVADSLVPETFSNVLLFAIPYFFFILFVGGGMEEFGWRGYAQQPLQERFGVVRASMLIGLVWGVWHLPLWAFPEAQGGYPAIAFVLHTTFISIVYGLLYNGSGRNLPVVLILHAAQNTIAPIFPYLHEVEGQPQNGYWVYVGVVVIAGLAAAYLIHRQQAPHTIDDFASALPN